MCATHIGENKDISNSHLCNLFQNLNIRIINLEQVYVWVLASWVEETGCKA